MDKHYTLPEVIEVLKYDHGLEGIQPIIVDFSVPLNQQRGEKGFKVTLWLLDKPDKERARRVLNRMAPELRAGIIRLVKEEFND